MGIKTAFDKTREKSELRNNSTVFEELEVSIVDLMWQMQFYWRRGFERFRFDIWAFSATFNNNLVIS